MEVCDRLRVVSAAVAKIIPIEQLCWLGFGHFEGRSWIGLLRHMILCQLVMLFVAEHTTRLRGG